MRFDISCVKNSCPFLFSFHLGYCTLLIYDSWVTTTVSHPPWPGPAHPVPTPGWWQLESNGHNVTYILVVTNVYIEIYRLFHCFSWFLNGICKIKWFSQWHPNNNYIFNCSYTTIWYTSLLDNWLKVHASSQQWNKLLIMVFWIASYNDEMGTFLVFLSLT